MLDRFDRMWYQSRCRLNSKSWETYFVWSVMHQALVDSYVTYVKANEGDVELSQLGIEEYMKRLCEAYKW